MTDLRDFLQRQIEVFVDYEFGAGSVAWTPDHTVRLVGHLAGNWEMVEEARRARQGPTAGMPKGQGLHNVKCDYCPVRFGCGCANPRGPHMCMRCDNEAEESKMRPGPLPSVDPGEIAQDRALEPGDEFHLPSGTVRVTIVNGEEVHPDA